VTYCNVRIDNVRCFDPPIYQFWMEHCEPCQDDHGWLFCMGHRACMQHGAEMRASAYRFTRTEWAADVVRIRSQR
jgi:hypothetical protein